MFHHTHGFLARKYSIALHLHPKCQNTSTAWYNVVVARNGVMCQVQIPIHGTVVQHVKCWTHITWSCGANSDSSLQKLLKWQQVKVTAVSRFIEQVIKEIKNTISINQLPHKRTNHQASSLLANKYQFICIHLLANIRHLWTDICWLADKCLC